PRSIAAAIAASVSSCSCTSGWSSSSRSMASAACFSSSALHAHPTMTAPSSGDSTTSTPPLAGLAGAEGRSLRGRPASCSVRYTSIRRPSTSSTVLSASSGSRVPLPRPRGKRYWSHGFQGTSALMHDRRNQPTAPAFPVRGGRLPGTVCRMPDNVLAPAPLTVPGLPTPCCLQGRDLMNTWVTVYGAAVDSGEAAREVYEAEIAWTTHQLVV